MHPTTVQSIRGYTEAQLANNRIITGYDVYTATRQIHERQQQNITVNYFRVTTSDDDTYASRSGAIQSPVSHQMAPREE